MRRSGQLDALFYEYPLHQLSLAASNINNAKIYQLNNPLFVNSYEKVALKKAQNEVLRHLKGLSSN